MEKKEVDEKEQESILRKYVTFYINRRSMQDLKNEAVSKGYKEEIFDKVYREIRSKTPQNFSTKNQQFKSIGKNQKFKESSTEGAPATQKSQETKLKKETIKGEEFVLIPVKKEEVERVLKNERSTSFFIPTQIATYVFCIILITAAGYSLYKSFSFQKIVGSEGEELGKASIFKMGYPLAFISVSAVEENPFSFNFFYLLIDFILYFIIAYAIDIMIRTTIVGMKTVIHEEIEKDSEEEKEKS